MLQRRILQDKSVVLFVQETKCIGTHMETLLKRIWKGCSIIIVDGDTPRGLEIIWNPMEITIQEFLATRNTISTSYHLMGTHCRG